MQDRLRAISGHETDVNFITKDPMTAASELSTPFPERISQSSQNNVKPKGALPLYCALVQRWQDDPLARFYLQNQALTRHREKMTDEDFLQKRMLSMSAMNQELFEKMLDFDSCEEG